MNTIERKSAGSFLIPLDDRIYEKRTICLEGEINDKSAMEFIKEVIELNRENEKEPIKVLISSPGGSVIHGLACYDAIVTSKAPVETYCIGTAYSMGAILFIAGNRRYMLKNSKLMLHQPLVGQNPGGNASSVKSLSDSLQETKRQLADIICKHTGMTKKQVEKQMSYDHYYTSEEAVKYKLADEIAGLEKII